jgi:DNA-binding response OmpR family regulator
MSSVKMKCCVECGQIVATDGETIEVGETVLNKMDRTVFHKGYKFKLTKTEEAMLRLLMGRAGRFLAPHAFFNAGVFHEDLTSQNINVYICKLRKKFRDVDPQFTLIENSHGTGYRWRPSGPPPKHTSFFPKASILPSDGMKFGMGLSSLSFAA